MQARTPTFARTVALTHRRAGPAAQGGGGEPERDTRDEIAGRPHRVRDGVAGAQEPAHAKDAADARHPVVRRARDA